MPDRAGVFWAPSAVGTLWGWWRRGGFLGVCLPIVPSGSFYQSNQVSRWWLHLFRIGRCLKWGWEMACAGSALAPPTSLPDPPHLHLLPLLSLLPMVLLYPQGLLSGPLQPT